MKNININYITQHDIAKDARLNFEIERELKNFENQSSSVILGLDPGIQMAKESLFDLDVRIKSEHDMQGRKVVTLMAALFTLLPTHAYAESCTATPDCKTLGYTQASCPNGGGVKCPWNTSLMYCCSGKSCADLGFTNSCNNSANGEVGGASTVCDGKYVYCQCATGYAWDAASKSCNFHTGLKDGLYHCNGIITGVQVGSENLVVALTDFSSSMTRGNALTESANYSFCGNTKGRLPTKNELLKVYNNISTVQSQLSANGGTQFRSSSYWSSSNEDSTRFWFVNPVSGATDNYYGASKFYARPVLSL